VQASRDAQAEAAASGERERIARDMHDVLAHSLAGLSIQLQAVRAVAGREGVGEVVTEPLQRAADLARDGIAEARAAVGALNPPAPRGVEAIEQLVARFPGDATWHSSGMPRQVEPSAGHAVYRAVQEALTNAARYAPGARVAVEVAWTDDQLVVSVSDGGAVRPASFAANGTGTGLASMTERIEQIGGRLEAGPSGSGWLVRVTLVPVTPSYPAMPSPIKPSPIKPSPIKP
jgi:signal transduction histidine kinase